ncbi:MAG: hypothetical protein IKP72_06275 [Clostridia bacterium]|nr:hypothetical protein [Clostridia bacterium]
MRKAARDAARKYAEDYQVMKEREQAAEEVLQRTMKGGWETGRPFLLEGSMKYSDKNPHLVCMPIVTWYR